jgi:hypothetical protein
LRFLTCGRRHHITGVERIGLLALCFCNLSFEHVNLVLAELLLSRKLIQRFGFVKQKALLDFHLGSEDRKLASRLALPHQSA